MGPRLIAGGPLDGAVGLLSDVLGNLGEALPADVLDLLEGATTTIEFLIRPVNADGNPLLPDTFALADGDEPLGFNMIGAPGVIEATKSASSQAQRSQDAKTPIRVLGLLNLKTVLPGVAEPVVDLVGQVIGTLSTALLPLAVPRVLALFRHREFARFQDARREISREGFVLVVAPESSPLKAANPGLEAAKDVINTIGGRSTGRSRH